MNTVVIESFKFLKDFMPEIRWIHQTGEVDYGRVLEAHQKAATQARVEKFIYDMPSCYSEASLLICRAGSSTLAEIAAVGRASVLIPLPTAADNHQVKNAEVFSSRGAAVLIQQGAQAGEQLADKIRDFLSQPQKVTELENQVTQFYRPKAPTEILEGLTS